MIEIEKPRIDTEVLSADGTFGKFVVEPLERGFGTTLGNSLRRDADADAAAHRLGSLWWSRWSAASAQRWGTA